MSPFRRFVTPQADGSFLVSFPSHVRELLVGLAGQLDDALDHDENPDLVRLFPTAYADDPERDAGYQVLARGELIDHRRESIRQLVGSAQEEYVSEEDLTAWMHVVNDVRLVLGTRLDVSEDSERIDPDDPNADLHELYHYLGAVLGELIDGLSAALPPEPD